MFNLLRQKDDKIPEYQGFIDQIREIHRLERDSDQLYKFALSLCEELYKYTGDSVWHKRLDDIVRKSSET